MTTQKRAVELAIKALQYICQRRYLSGEEAYKSGVDLDFATRGHQYYTEYQEAIKLLQSLIEQPQQLTLLDE